MADKKEEKKPTFLEKITLFKEPMATNFGGVLTTLIPIVLLAYAIYIARAKATDAPNIVSNSTTIDYGEIVNISVACASEHDCVIFDPLTFLFTYSVASSVTILKFNETKDFQVFFSDTDPALAVAHAKCYTGNVTELACTDPEFAPQINTKVFWDAQPNPSTLPKFPLNVTNYVVGGYTGVDGRSSVWTVKLKYSEYYSEGAIFLTTTDLVSPEDANPYQFAANSAQDNVDLLNLVCPSMLQRPGCDAQQLIDDFRIVPYWDFDPTSKPFATFASLYIDPEKSTTYFTPLDFVQIAFEVVGQIGGAYSLVFAALKGVHAIYLFLSGKIERKEFMGVAKEVFGEVSGKDDKKKSAPLDP